MGIQFTAFDEANIKTVTFSDGRTATFPDSLDLGEEWEFFSLSNTTGQLVMGGLLGFEFEDCGSASIVELRRAIMRARATFARQAPGLTLAPSHTPGGHAGVRTRTEGNVTCMERMGAECHSHGVDEDRLARRLNSIADLVEAAAQAGATGVSWG
jgi:hypothetical protein